MIDVDAIVKSLKDKPKERVPAIIKKMKLPKEVAEEVLKRLGIGGKTGIVFVPTESLGYLMALANPIIRTGLKSLMLSTPWQGQVRAFVERIYREFGSSDSPISPEVIELILKDLGVPALEASNLAKKAGELAGLEDPTQINYLIREITKRAAKLKVREDIEDFLDGKKDVMGLVESVGAIKDLSTFAHLPVMNLAELTPSEVFRQYGGLDAIPSFFDFINEALPTQGYQRGQLVMVNAPPGVGKTTFMLNEAIHAASKGLKVLYVSLGDMMPQDFFVKIIGIVKDLNVKEVLSRVDDLWRDEEVQEIARNMKVSVLPAGSLTADELYAATTKKVSGEEYDVIMVDYDANLKVEGDLTMYERGRLVYEVLSAISRDEPFKLVMVGSQIKPMYWNRDYIPLDAAAESSNKQAVVDVMITIGKNPGKKKVMDSAFVHAGYLNIAKARRGLVTPTSFKPYKLTTSGRFLPISEAEYADLYHPVEDNRRRR